MNILLVNPPSSFILRSFNEISLPDMPLNLAYIASCLEATGHDVRIIDMNVVETVEDLQRRLHELDFHLAGFTSTTPAINACYRTIKIIKLALPGIKIMLGGWHASALPSKTLQECKEIDYIIRGEGEKTCQELVTRLTSGGSLENVKGLAYRDDAGKIQVTEERPLIHDIDAIPYPARHLLDLDAYRRIGFYTVGGYFKKDLYLSSMITSRGCAFNCTFCADSTIYKSICRLRSPENVIAEIKHMIHEHDIRIFFITDANFTLSKKRVKRICTLLLEEELEIMWGCAARVDCVSPDLLKLMKKAGCIRISYGIESGSSRVLKLMNKCISIKQIRDAVRMTKQVGIPVYVYFVYGMPDETLDDARKSGRLLMELKPDYVTHSIATPFPGSQLYDEALDRGILKNVDWDMFNYPFNYVIINPNFKEIFRYQASVLKKFYLSPHFIMNTLKNLKSIYHVLFYLRAFKYLIIYMFTFR